MKRLLGILVFLVVSLNVWSQTLEEILKEPLIYDGKKVVVQGEAIGEALRDKDGLWINISYQGYNIGIFFRDKILTNKIKNFGSYKMRGDMLEVKGIFYAICPFHAQRDIHADGVEVVEKGEPRIEKVAEFKITLSYVLAIICLTLGGVYFIKIKYGKRD